MAWKGVKMLLVFGLVLDFQAPSDGFLHLLGPATRPSGPRNAWSSRGGLSTRITHSPLGAAGGEVVHQGRRMHPHDLKLHATSRFGSRAFRGVMRVRALLRKPPRS